MTGQDGHDLVARANSIAQLTQRRRHRCACRLNKEAAPRQLRTRFLNLSAVDRNSGSAGLIQRLNHSVATHRAADGNAVGRDRLKQQGRVLVMYIVALEGIKHRREWLGLYAYEARQ